MTLARDPICTLCGKAPSVIADHVIPRSVRPDLELDLGNTRGVCERCHNSLGMNRGRFGGAR